MQYWRQISAQQKQTHLLGHPRPRIQLLPPIPGLFIQTVVSLPITTCLWQPIIHYLCLSFLLVSRRNHRTILHSSSQSKINYRPRPSSVRGDQARGQNLAIVNSLTRSCPPPPEATTARDVNKQVADRGSRRTQQPYLVNAGFCSGPWA